MRPYLEWHGDLDVVFNYILRPGSEPLGGTLPSLGNRDLKSRLGELSSSISAPKPFLHMTLSLPNGYRAPKKVWLRLVEATLRSLGMEPDAMPWFAARHNDSTCDHIHSVTVLQDFSGRDIVVSGSREKSEAIHRELCRMTGLPQPDYFDPSAGPRLLPVTPARNLANADKKQLHKDLEHTFLYHQPESLGQLNSHLAVLPGGFKGIVAETWHGTPSIVWKNQNAEFFTGELGMGWEPRFVKARLKFANVLRTIRHDIDLHHLSTLFLTSKMDKLLATTIANARARETGNGSEDHPRSTLEDGQKRDVPASFDRPLEFARESRPNAGRPIGGTADGSKRNAKKPPRAAEGNDQSTDTFGEYSRNRNDGGAGSAGTTRQTYQPDPADIGTTPHVTFGALLARVCHVAAKSRPGWRLKLAHVAQLIGIRFGDGSTAEVAKDGVQIIEDGYDAQEFEKEFQTEMPESHVGTETLNDPSDDGFGM